MEPHPTILSYYKPWQRNKDYRFILSDSNVTANALTNLVTLIMLQIIQSQLKFSGQMLIETTMSLYCTWLYSSELSAIFNGAHLNDPPDTIMMSIIVVWNLLHLSSGWWLLRRVLGWGIILSIRYSQFWCCNLQTQKKCSGCIKLGTIGLTQGTYRGFRIKCQSIMENVWRGFYLQSQEAII